MSEDVSKVLFSFENFTMSKHGIPILHNLNCSIFKNSVTSLIGQNQNEKSLFLSLIHRASEMKDFSCEGKCIVDFKEIAQSVKGMNEHRRQFPLVYDFDEGVFSHIFDAVSFGAKIKNIHSLAQRESLLENSLKITELWDDVKQKLYEPISSLTKEQRFRLSLARTLCLEPKCILLDDFSYDIASHEQEILEHIFCKIKKQCSVIINFSDIRFAARVSDYTLFFQDGILVEHDVTARFFTRPKQKQTERFLAFSVSHTTTL